jgi:hypothetical protein
MHEFRVPNMGARDLELVKAANPLSTITKAELAEMLDDPTLDYGEDWLRQTCNIPARSSHAAISDQDWAAAYTEERIPAGVPIWLGADFAWVDDTTALVPLWIRDEGFRLLGTPAILTPPRDGNMLDPQEVRDALRADPCAQPDRVHRRRRHEGPGHAVVGGERARRRDVNRGQGPQAQSEEYESFMDGLREKKLRHTGDQALTQHA